MRLAIYLCGIAVLPAVLAATLITARVVPPGAAFTLQYWQWGPERRLAEGEAADLDALPVDAICWWCGSISLESGSPRFHTRGGPLTGADDIPRWVVVRVDPSCNPLLAQDTAGLRREILKGLERGRATGPVSGLQIDWDVPSRRLREYAACLTDLRRDLPAAIGLSCTGLVAWLDAAQVGAVARAVDWWVPQCYSTDVPDDLSNPTALVCRVDPGSVAERCASLDRPFRIGVPAFEQASLWDKNGRLVSASLPIASEDALAAGFDAVVIAAGAAPGQERLVRFTARRDAVIAGRTIPSGATLMIGQPTVPSTSVQIASVRAHGGPWCRGISLFRFPDAGTSPCLSTTQMRAAWMERAAADPAPAPARPMIRWRWEGGPPEPWTLSVANEGLADRLDLERPLRLDIASPLVPGGSPASMRVLPALSGVPTGPAHATGSLVMIPFLRSGATVSLTFPASGAEPPAAAMITDEVPP